MMHIILINKEEINMSIYHNFNELVGHTPILELQNTKAKEHLKANIFAKLEYYNPAGSIRSRCKTNDHGCYRKWSIKTRCNYY